MILLYNRSEKLCKGMVKMKSNIGYRKVNEDNAKMLADVFKEINEIRGNNTFEENFKKQYSYFENEKNARTKKLRKLIAIDLVIMLFISFSIFANYIFAFTSVDNQIENIEAVAAVEFEANSSALIMEDILLENISILRTKELLEEERKIEFEIKHIDDENLPLGEEVVSQEGVLGSKNVTVINTFENEELVEENILEEEILEKPIEQIILVGTSEFLKEKQIQIGSTIYAIEELELKEQKNKNSQSICKIPAYLEVNLEKMDGEYCKVKYKEQIGYILSSKLTSSKSNPEILEKNRIQKLKLSLNENMALNKSSGLTLEDFKKILSNNPSDKNNIFTNAAEDFYKADKTYNVNGVFLASIGIHESAWGTSKIAADKKNLFGYGAYDASPYESAYAFDTYYAGIELLAKSLSKNYLNQSGTILPTGEIANGIYYNGNTAAAVNIRYASDPLWHTKVYNYMTKLYNNL